MNGCELMELCAVAGLTGDDTETAIRTYRKRGPLSRAEIAHYAALPPAARTLTLVGNYGSDAARVAALVVDRG